MVCLHGLSPDGFAGERPWKRKDTAWTPELKYKAGHTGNMYSIPTQIPWSVWASQHDLHSQVLGHDRRQKVHEDQKSRSSSDLCYRHCEYTALSHMHMHTHTHTNTHSHNTQILSHTHIFPHTHSHSLIHKQTHTCTHIYTLFKKTSLILGLRRVLKPSTSLVL